jgi:PAS domain S-box-containing protein
MTVALEPDGNPIDPDPAKDSVRPQRSILDSSVRQLLGLLLVAAAYFIAARLGLSLAFTNKSVSPVWPPTGIALAGLLLLGYRASPGVFLGAFLANYLLTPVSILAAAGIAGGNTLEALTALFLLQRFTERKKLFDRAANVLKFIIFAVILSTAVCATIGNLVLWLASAETSSQFGSLWLTWWLGDAVGALVVTPLILTWVESRAERFSVPRLIETAASLVALSIVSGIIFTNFVLDQSRHYAIGHLIIPGLLWVAFRFGPRGGATAITLVSAIAIWGTTHNLGPYSLSDQNHALLLLQAFIADIAITTLVLATVVAERKGVETKLRQQTETLKLAHAFARDLDDLITVWYAGAEKQYGFTASEAVGTRSHELLQTIYPEPLDEIRRKLFWDGTWEGELVHRAKDGRRLTVAAHFSLYRDERGRPAGILEVNNDITEEKHTEQALLESREWLRMTMEGGRMGTWTRDLDESNRVLWSPELERIFGLSPGEFSQTEGEFFNFVHPDDRTRLAEAVRAAIEHKTDYDIEFRYTPKGNGQRWMLGRGRALYDESGKPYRLAGLGWDITERKQAEQALAESRAQLGSTIASAMDAIITVDRDQRIVIFNAAAEKMFRCPASEAIGQPIDRFIPERFRLAHREHIRFFGDTQVTRRSMGQLGAIFGSRADGEEFPIEASISQIEVSGRPLFTVILRDITQRKQVEDERERLLASEHAARTEAEAANRTKDEFLAMLSHELRTPLTAMLGWLAILRGQRVDDQTFDRGIEAVERNAKIQAHLIEDLVDVSRIIGGKLSLEVRPIDLSPVIRAAIEVVRPAADAKGVDIEFYEEPFVGPVSGDATRLRQVVWNLLSNAVKFTPRDGSVNVSLQHSQSSAKIVVRDSGAGIPQGFLPHVFERFRQAESSVTRSHRGLGLGLAIVRHLVELHGGTVLAESDGQGKGATFTINLPLAAISASQLEPGLPLAKPISEGVTAAPLSGLRVLVVEDEFDAGELISLALEYSGAKVEVARSAQDGLRALSIFKPDVLLSDIGLPGESGYDLIRKIRSSASEANEIPAVALTAFASERDRESALAAGFQVHLAKPVQPHELVKVVERLANRQRN